MEHDVEYLRREIEQIRSELAVTARELRQVLKKMKGGPRSVATLLACAAGVTLTSLAATPDSSLPSKVGPLVVQAPFQVVDSSNHVIFHVQEEGSKLYSPREKRAESDEEPKPVAFGNRGIYVLDPSNHVVAFMINSFEGGFIKVMESGHDGSFAAMVAGSIGEQIKIRQDEKVKVEIYSDPTGNGVVNVYGIAEQFAAGMNGAGTSGQVAVYSPAGKPISLLGESEAFPGSGSLAVMDAAGMVGFYARGLQTGGQACIQKDAKEFCIGPQVSISAH